MPSLASNLIFAILAILAGAYIVGGTKRKWLLVVMAFALTWQGSGVLQLPIFAGIPGGITTDLMNSGAPSYWGLLVASLTYLILTPVKGVWRHRIAGGLGAGVTLVVGLGYLAAASVPSDPALVGVVASAQMAQFLTTLISVGLWITFATVGRKA